MPACAGVHRLRALCTVVCVFGLAVLAKRRLPVVPEPRVSRLDRTRKSIAGLLQKVQDEVKYRVSSAEAYRSRLLDRVDSALDELHTSQNMFAEAKLRDVQAYVNRTRQLYDEYREEVQRKQALLADLAMQEMALRRRPIDASLEAFKRRYNESMTSLETHKQKIGSLTQDGLLSRKHQIDDLFDELESRTRVISTNVTKELQQVDALADSAMTELRTKLQAVLDEAASTRERFVVSYKLGTSKLDLNNQRSKFEEAVRGLADQQSNWFMQFGAKEGQIETVLAQLREQFQSTSKLYEEIISRKVTGLNVDALNDETLKRVLDCIEENDGWQFVTDTHGVRVYRKFMSKGTFGSKYACVKASAVLSASAEDIYTLFQDNTRVCEYNKYFAKGKDLEELNDNTKVVWASSPPLFPFKARDFCTVVHFRRLEDGTIVVLNRAAVHPAAPTLPQYVRAQIIMGANLIQPIKGNPNKCIFTTVTQVDPGGFSPPVIVNQICSQGPVNFFRLVEKAAQASTTKRTETNLPAVKPLQRHPKSSL